MKYLYEDLSEDQFEELVTAICEEILGSGVTGFTKGPDGGRDARFNGTAQLHPSTASPWVGQTIVQAKHASGFNMSYSDTRFFSPTSNSSTIHDEIVRIRKLKENSELDNYLLFSNRKLSALADERIRKAIVDDCGIADSSIFLVGLNKLEAYLKRFPHVASRVDLSLAASPLIVSPEELADVVEAFSSLTDDRLSFSSPEDRVPYAEKNELNGLSPEYADEWRKRCLKDTESIREFLSDPRNAGLARKYDSVTEEIQMKILAHWSDEDRFELVVDRITNLLINRDVVLGSNRRLTRSFVFYMYWSCDIGKRPDD